MNHVHIGPSPLALGLLVPCTIAAGFEVVLLGRAGDSGPREYVHVDTGSGERVVRQLSAFEGPHGLADVSGEVRSRVESKDPLLLTCTLRGAIVNRRDLVAEVLQARPEGAETVFVACENSPHPMYGELEEEFAAAGAVALRAVVNRMCREDDERDEEGRRVVLAHTLGEWLFEAPAAPLPLLKVLTRAPEVTVVEDYAARKDRKLWMVNGTHQALALFALNASVVEFDIGAEGKQNAEESGRDDDLTKAARRREVIVKISHLHGPMNEALARLHPHLTGNLKYGMEHVLAYMEHPDSIKRVLSEFQRRELAPFIATMEDRLGRPARICFEESCSVEAFQAVLDVFEDVVGDLDAFLDAPKIRLDSTLVSKAADERAVAAYARFIGTWVPAAEAKERVERFAGALRRSSPL